MKTLSSDIKTAVAEYSQRGTWVKLYEIQVNADTAFGDGTNEYLTNYQKQLTYSSKNYRPFPIFHEAGTETAKPEQTTFTVVVANIDRAIANYLESGKILGNKVKITSVFIKADTEELVFAFDDVYDILAAEMNNAQATFEVGQTSLFSIKLPRNHWHDARCEFVYRSIGHCHYGRDEFLGTSRLVVPAILVNGSLLVQGWRVMNAANAALWDIDLTFPDELLIRVASTVNTQWSASAKTGPFLYRIFTAADFINFEVEVKFNSSGDENNETLAALFSTDSDSTQDWILAGRRRFSGVDRIQLHSMDNNTPTTVYDQASTNPIIKVKKTGSLWELFSKATEAAAYGAALASVSRADLNNIDLRAGLTAETYSAARSTALDARFDYWRLLTGGKATCARVFEGADGCKAHDNSLRYGGAVAILHGAIQF